MRPLLADSAPLWRAAFSSYALSAPESEPAAGYAGALSRRSRAQPPMAAMRRPAGVIHLLKYGSVGRRECFGRMLAESIAELAPDFPTRSIAVIPVPLYRAKLRQREFNHAELIARTAIKLTAPGRLHLCAGALERKRETVSQTGLTRHQDAKMCAARSEWRKPKP